MNKTRLFTFIASISFLAFTSLHSSQDDYTPGGRLSGDDETSFTLNNTFDNSTTPYGENEMKDEGVYDKNSGDEHLNDDQKGDIDDEKLLRNSSLDRPKYGNKDKHKPKSIRLHSASELTKMTNEELEIVDRMPECIEKYVYQLQIYLKLFKLQKEDKNSSITNLSLEDNIEQSIQNCLKNSQKKQISKKILSIKQNFRKDREAALRDTSNLLKEIQPLNLERIFHLIEKADLAKCQVVNKDVILLLGDTGAGKSTAIFTLVGCKMEEQQIDNLTHIGPTDIPSKYKEHLKGIISSPHAKSQTRHISAVPIDLSDMGILCKPSSVVLCDTPGFNDTAGPEEELANGKGIIEALKKAKSIKLVILIPFSTLDYNRMQGMRSLVHTLTNLIPSIQDHFSSVVYIFTKTTEKQEKDIGGRFENMLKILNDSTQSATEDESFSAIFDDIHYKHKKGRTIVLRPLETDTEELWRKIMDKKSTFILKPENVLQPFITPNSYNVLSLQITKLQTSIQEAVHAQNYKLLQYQLTQFQNISKLFPQRKEIQSALDESMQTVTSIWNETYQETFKKIKNQLEPKNSLDKKAILAYQELIRKMASEEGKSIQKYLSGRKNSEDAIGYTAAQQKLNKKIEDFGEGLEKTAFNDPSLLPQLKKLHTITQIFESLQYISDKIRKELLQRIKATEKGAQNSITDGQFKIFLGDYNILHEALPIEKFFRKNPLLPKVLENLQKDLQKIFKETTQKSIRYFPQNNNEKTLKKNEVGVSSKKGTLSSHNIKQIKETLETLETGLQCFINQDLFTHLYEQINTYQTELLEGIHSYVEGCEVTIRRTISSASEDAKSFDTIKKHYENIEKMREIESVQKKTTAAYYSVREAFQQCFRQVSDDISKIIQEIFSNSSNTKKKVKQLIQCVNCIQNTEWFDKNCIQNTKLFDKKGGKYKKTSEELLESIEKDLLYYLKRCQKVAQKMTLGIDNLPQCKQACNLYSILEEVQELGNIVPALNAPIKEIKKNIERCIQSTCRSINTSFSVKNTSKEGKLKLKELLSSLQEANKIKKTATEYLSTNGIKNIKLAKNQIKEKTQKRDSMKEEISISQKNKEELHEAAIKEGKRLEAIKNEYNKRVSEALSPFNKPSIQANSDNENSEEKTASEYLQSQGFTSLKELQEKITDQENYINDISRQDHPMIKQQEELIQELKKLNSQVKHYEDSIKEAKSLYDKTVYDLKNQGCKEKSIERWFLYPETIQQRLDELDKEIKEYEKRKTKYKFGKINPRKIEQTIEFIKICSEALCNDQLNLLFTT